MKIILSRKGFDSANGGIPSPIMPDNTMLSLPIPGGTDDSEGRKENIKYSDLKYKLQGKEITYRDIISSLYDSPHSFYVRGRKDDSIKYFGACGPSEGSEDCHLDPDLIRGLNPYSTGLWNAAFGQVKAAQSHLLNLGINKESINNDILFLFFGWFRETKYEDNRLLYTANQFQAIYGYMFVEDILKTEDIKSNFPWHPHANSESPNNTLYVAKEKQIINGKEFPGFGTFKFNKLLRLTKKDETPSRWDYEKLPKGMKEGDVTLTYHSKESSKPNYFQSAGIGQEFVFSDNDNVTEWAHKIITKSTVYES